MAEMVELLAPPISRSADARQCDTCHKSHAGLYVCQRGCTHWVTGLAEVMRAHDDNTHPSLVIADLRAALAAVTS